MNLCEGSVAVVPQDRRWSMISAQHDVEITIGINVRGPCAGVSSIQDRCRQFSLRGHVAELLCASLFQQMNAACSSQHKISFEVVVEIQPGDSIWSRRDCG